MSRSPEDYLQHILDEAEYLFQSSQNGHFAGSSTEKIIFLAIATQKA